jgi:hypothetical protein
MLYCAMSHSNVASVVLNESHLASVVICGWVWLSVVCYGATIGDYYSFTSTLHHAGELFISYTHDIP